MSKEFFWTVLRVEHDSCPFVSISKTFGATVRPRFFDLHKESVETMQSLDVCLYVDTYISPEEMNEMQQSISDTFSMMSFNPNASENRTIIIGTVRDRAVNEIIGQLRSIPTMYAHQSYEYVVVTALADYQVWRSLIETLESKISTFGNVELTKMGKVTNVEEYRMLRLESQYVEKPISALSTEENIILSQAIAHGYYELPRRLNLEDLSHRLGMKKTTLHMKLRRIEEKLLLNATEKGMII